MIDRLAPLAAWFTAGEWPNAVCPHCGNGTLSADEAQTLESTQSHEAHSHEAWDPDWMHGYFFCVLRCQNSRCREIVVATGDWRVRPNSPRGWEDPDYVDELRLRSTIPALPILTVPKQCPDTVRDSAAKAGGLIWTDPGGAGNRLRLAIEHVLTDRHVPRFAATKPRRPLSTQQRINRLRAMGAQRAQAAEILEAVKWIGNQGTHEDSLTVKDVLEAAEILEHALSLLYDTTPADIRRRARQINRAKRLPHAPARPKR